MDLRKIAQAVRRALCMIFALGLPWIFGFIMLLSKEDAIKTVFSYIFTIFNSLQVRITCLSVFLNSVTLQQLTKPSGCWKCLICIRFSRIKELQA